MTVGETLVIVEIEDRIARLTLNRPDAMNSINGAMLDQLHRAVQDIPAEGVNAVVLAGSGRGFCAGADLGEVARLSRDPGAFSAFLDKWHAAFDAVAACPVPTIAAVHGFAVAGGFELMLCCDIVVAAVGTKIGDQHAKFGLFPAGGSTQRLPRLIGERRARWWLYSGEQIPIEDAQVAGLINRVADGDVLDEAMRMAGLLAQRSDRMLRLTKWAVSLAQDTDVAQAIGIERPHVLDHIASDHGQEGLSAFQEHRTPDFTKTRTKGQDL